MNYSFVREDFDKNSISGSILSIQVLPDGFSFVISPADKKFSPGYILVSTGNDAIAGGMGNFNEFDNKEFHSIRVIICENNFTLVPEYLFDLKDMKSYLRLNHPVRKNRKYLSNLIRPLQVVTVFSMDEGVYRLVKNKFPGADFCHTSLPLFTYAANTERDCCIIQVYEKSMELVIIKQKNLRFYNMFLISSDNDIVYHTLNTYRSQFLDQLSFPLLISGSISPESDAGRLLPRYIRYTDYYDAGNYNLAETGNGSCPPHYFLNHREILECEL